MIVLQVLAKMEELVLTVSIRILAIAISGSTETIVKQILMIARQAHVKTVVLAMMA